jgi:hypothetical protein
LPYFYPVFKSLHNAIAGKRERFLMFRTACSGIAGESLQAALEPNFPVKAEQ